MYLFHLTPLFKYAEMDLMSDLVSLSVHFLNNIAEGRVWKSVMFFMLNASPEPQLERW